MDTNILPHWLTNERYDEIYDTVSQYCILQGTIPPPMDKDLLRKLAILFPESDAEVSDRIHENSTQLNAIKNKYSLQRNLERKCKRLPKQIDSLEYFIKVLGGKMSKHDYKPMSLVLLD